MYNGQQIPMNQPFHFCAASSSLCSFLFLSTFPLDPSVLPPPPFYVVWTLETKEKSVSLQGRLRQHERLQNRDPTLTRAPDLEGVVRL